jgi:hypothetical protein
MGYRWVSSRRVTAGWWRRTRLAGRRSRAIVLGLIGRKRPTYLWRRIEFHLVRAVARGRLIRCRRKWVGGRRAWSNRKGRSARWCPWNLTERRLYHRCHPYVRKVLLNLMDLWNLLSLMVNQTPLEWSQKHSLSLVNSARLLPRNQRSLSVHSSDRGRSGFLVSGLVDQGSCPAAACRRAAAFRLGVPSRHRA